jgi:hypothetical protein
MTSFYKIQGQRRLKMKIKYFIIFVVFEALFLSNTTPSSAVPHVETLLIKNNSTNIILNPSSQIELGTTVRAEIGVRNDLPASLVVKVRLLIDENQSSPWDSEQTSSEQTIFSNGIKTFLLTFTPAQVGTFYRLYEVKTKLPNGTWETSDFGNWSQVFLVKPPTGNLCVTMSPQGAINLGAQWRRVGTSTWYNSGYTETDVPVGQCKLEFKDIPGWTKPDEMYTYVYAGETKYAGNFYTQQIGNLRVDIFPQGAVAAGAQWRRVGTSTWFNDGYIELNLPLGQCTIEFKDIPGWTKPSNLNIIIEQEETKVGVATYIQQTGNIQVTIYPQGAVDAGAQWRRVGTSIWHNSGYIENGVPVNECPVEFKDIPGWTKPPNLPFTVAQDHTTYASASYAQQTGKIQVRIYPLGAVNAGAQWRRVGTQNWLNSGDIESNIPVGLCTVEYKYIPGWFKPENMNIAVAYDDQTLANGFYTQQTGTLSIKINPQGAIDAGAKWRLVQTSTWLNSGDILPGLPYGNYTVEFKDISGWTKPPKVNVIIENESITVLNIELCTYTPITQSGNLSVTVRNVNGKVYPSALVKRYDGSGSYLDQKITDVNGNVIWNSIPTGVYKLEAYCPNLIFGDEFWANDSTYVSGGLTTNKSLNENYPFWMTYSFLKNSSGEPINLSGSIAPGTEVKFEIGVRNILSESMPVKVRLLYDQSQSSPWDSDITSSEQISSPQGINYFSFLYTPTLLGTWYFAFEIKTRLPNGNTTTTNSLGWDQAFVVDQRTGGLCITISPLAAINAGAQWRRIGTQYWFNSGNIETNIPIGTRTLEFKDVPGWGKPSNLSLPVYSDATTNANVSYVNNTGKLCVIIHPQGAIDAGAQWRRVGTPIWFNSEETEVNLPPGQCIVEFKDIHNWERPVNQSGMINSNETLIIGGYYILKVAVSEIPKAFKVWPPFPNPMNPETTIKYEIPAECYVSLRIYNVHGKQVSLLKESICSAGIHNVVWDGKDDKGMPVGSGVYLYHLRAESYIHTGKVVLVR